MDEKKITIKSIKKVLKKNIRIVIGGIMIIILILMGIFAPLIAPMDPTEQDLISILQTPNSIHVFGTDEFGRDIFSRIIYGIRISLVEICLSVGLALIIGIILGLVAGYYGGIIDQIIMWFLDILAAFPGIILAILIITVMGTSLYNMLIAISLYSVPTFGRLVRNSTFSLKNKEYVLAAKAIGVSDRNIMLKHIFKNSLTPLLVQASLTAGGVILSASSLSFLGFGAQPPTPEWGAMIGKGRNYIGIASHLCLFPGLAILYTVLAFNFFGDGLRDFLDPNLKNKM